MQSTILGLPSGVFLLWMSSFFFLVSSVIILKPLFEKKDKLTMAFFIWLLGMGLLHLFLGLGILFNTVILLHLGVFFGLTGSAYLIRIPFSGLIPRYEKTGFYLVLLAGWLIVAWMFLWPHVHSIELMLRLLFGYMILIAGILPGPYLIWMGVKSKSRAVKVKAVGGGIGIISCCLIADVFVLFAYMGVAFWPEFLMTIAPVILITAVLWGRKIEKQEEALKNNNF